MNILSKEKVWTIDSEKVFNFLNDWSINSLQKRRFTKAIFIEPPLPDQVEMDGISLEHHLKTTAGGACAKIGGNGSLIAAIEYNAGLTVQYIDGMFQPELVMDIVEHPQTDILYMFSTIFNNYRVGADLAKKIKQKTSGKAVCVVGGQYLGARGFSGKINTPSAANVVMNVDFLSWDVAFAGLGEVGVVKYIKAMQGQASYDINRPIDYFGEIEGLVYIDESGYVKENLPHRPCEISGAHVLDDIMMPEPSVKHFMPYLDKYMAIQSEQGSVCTPASDTFRFTAVDMLGCERAGKDNRCVYCSIPWEKASKSPERVWKEILWVMKETGLPPEKLMVHSTDDTIVSLSNNGHEADKINALVNSRNSMDIDLPIRWRFYSVAYVTQEIIKSYKELFKYTYKYGQFQNSIFVGVETYDDDVLTKSMGKTGKNLSTNSSLNAIDKLVNEVGVLVNVGGIVGNIGETPEKLRRTIDSMIYVIEKYNGNVTHNRGLPAILPGSILYAELYNHAKLGEKYQSVQLLRDPLYTAQQALIDYQLNYVKPNGGITLELLQEELKRLSDNGRGTRENSFSGNIIPLMQMCEYRDNHMFYGSYLSVGEYRSAYGLPY